MDSASKTVFLKYGYRRVTMNDLAQAAGMSRPALYLVFPKKEDVFCGVVREMARQISDEVSRGLESIRSPIEKLKFVCELWMVRPFDWVNESPEAKEVYESSHEFAAEAVNESILSFERNLASVIELLPKGTLPKGITHTHAAHLLAGSIMGVKKACRTADEARKGDPRSYRYDDPNMRGQNLNGLEDTWESAHLTRLWWDRQGQVLIRI